MSEKKDNQKPSPKKLSEREQKQNRKRDLAAISFFILGIFLIFLAVIKGNSFWGTMHNTYFGLFGFLAYFVPLIFIGVSIVLTINDKILVNRYKFMQIFILVVLIASLVHILSYNEVHGTTFLQIFSYVWQDGVSGKGGGMFGALIGVPFLAFLGKTGATITILLATSAFVLIVTGITLLDLLKGVKVASNKIGDIRKNEKNALSSDDTEENPTDETKEAVKDTANIDIKINSTKEEVPLVEEKKVVVKEETKEQQNFSEIAKLRENKVIYEDNPMETFIKPEKIQMKNRNSFANQNMGSNSSYENTENFSELEQLIRKSVPILIEDDLEITKTQEDVEDAENTKTEKPIFSMPDFTSKKSFYSENDIERLSEGREKRPNIDISLGDDNITPPTQSTPKESLSRLPKNREFTTESVLEYIYPPVSLLNESKVVTDEDMTDELKANAETLVDTLKSFGVETRVIDISRGPTVTRYELQPKKGVKISRITNLSDDIALNLAAAGVRIEAPIPGKPAVGVEIPNKQNSIVSLREIITSNKFENAKSKLSFALGKDITGKAVVTDIAKMPHVLIAGATGSGKSVCINSIIISLLYKSTPDEVRFLMIDPKIVELGVYNNIPHLLIPVVTDPKKAAGALNWAVNEMQKRYNIFAKYQVRDLSTYNAMAKGNEEIETMPQIVIIIDELSDLMMVASSEVETSIARLAQMARAAGMHLVIATQRPSVDVITGIIKANIPSRIAFSVSSSFDSRTILDSSGAEKLLGKGDMLFYPSGQAKPSRVQGCFVDDKEVERVVAFIKKTAAEDSIKYDDNIIEEIENLTITQTTTGSSLYSEEDELLDEAIEIIFENNQASTSFLQRRLRVGYARAARMIDMIEEKGIISMQEGSKARDILMTKEQWKQTSNKL